MPEVLENVESAGEACDSFQPGDMPQMETFDSSRVRLRKKSLATFMKANQPCSSACCSEGIEKMVRAILQKLPPNPLDVLGTA